MINEPNVAIDNRIAMILQLGWQRLGLFFSSRTGLARQDLVVMNRHAVVDHGNAPIA
jgi:hypothetical protein